MAKSKKESKSVRPITEALTVPQGPVDLSSYDTRATPGFDGDKAEGKSALPLLGEELADLQERLYADGRSGGTRSVLLVLQGMDTSGKGGAIRHAIGLLDPQGVQLTSFKAPTAEEKKRGFLWRIQQQVPVAGMVGIFDRSHYEDVLIARVRGLSPTGTITRRYESINEFEQKLVDRGTTLVKCMLHISRDEQKARLQERLADPTKHWKFNPGDVDERERWADYQEAYEVALERGNTEKAPWLVVPSDRKWYRDWAVTKVLIETLHGMDLAWPTADFDVAEQSKRLAAT